MSCPVLCSWWKKQDKKANGHVTISDDTLMETRKKFQQYDTNDSGSIDRDELTGLIRALHLEKYVPKCQMIEATAAGPGIRVEKPAEEVAPLAAQEEPIVEGELKQFHMVPSLSLIHI